MRRTLLAAMAVGACTMLAVVGAATAAPLPTPGTPAQIQALVKASASTSRLTPVIEAQLESSRYDIAWRIYPSLDHTGCETPTSCVFGDTSSSKVIVLFGDSHAMMWLPAIAPIATKDDQRLVVMWLPSCPVANLKDFSYDKSTPITPGCTAWRTTAISEIHAMKPELVLLGERTAQVYSQPSDKLFTNAEWEAALKTPIEQLQGPTTKVAIIEDVPYYDVDPPQSCLAAYPDDIVKKCAVPYPNTKNPGHQTAEQAAAKATGAGFIPTVQWLCTKTCSTVVGNFISYYDQGHVSATYADYLSGVMGAAVEAQLK